MKMNHVRREMGSRTGVGFGLGTFAPLCGSDDVCVSCKPITPEETYEVLILSSEAMVRSAICSLLGLTSPLRDIAKNKECILTTVYAPAQEQDKDHIDHIWQHLKQLNNSITLSWCIIGDFNEMIHPSDEVGGTPLTVHKTHRFNDFLAATESINTNVQGRIFT
ncbi:hypothetical protein Cgig2_023577 [Carnegiea gigantea]|uniref:Endonuclease/exonuclease/phosphatase domain-containing protein n=1 Tax=Carnegiea gigantea TaxID=171969 RepID=A0A9Q1GZS6_9CARY|nr:hypothetical protein Cgig2_023577 [Carnegiea gigantea]